MKTSTAVLPVVLTLSMLWGCPSCERMWPARQPELLPLPPLPDLGDFDPAPREQLLARHSTVTGLLRAGPGGWVQLGDAYGRLGEVFHAYMQLEPAFTCYRNARNLNPEAFRWVYLLGHAQRTFGDHAAATASFTQALKLRPADVPTLVWLAETELEQHHLGPARNRFQQALDVDPNCTKAYLGLAQVRLELGEFAQVVVDLEKALAAQPQASQIHYVLALAYRSLGDDQRAHRFFERLSDRQAEIPIAFEDPLLEEVGDLRASAQFHQRRGLTATGRGLFDVAVREFELAMAADPDRPMIRYNLAGALLKLGRRQESIEQLYSLIARAPDYTLSYILLARIFAEDGDPENAEHYLRRALNVDPNSEGAHLVLGDQLSDAGRLEEALASYHRAQELRPELASARFGATVTLMRLGRFEEALIGAQESTVALPERRELRMLLARLLAAIPEKSLRDGERALDLAYSTVTGGETVVDAETIAMALAEQGRFGEAIRWQRAAVRRVEAAGGGFGWVRRRLSSYERGIPCRTPWAAGEKVSSLPIQDDG